MNRWQLVATVAVVICAGATVKSCRDRVELEADVAGRDSALVALKQQIKDQTPIYLAHTDTFNKVQRRYDTLRTFAERRITDTLYVKELIATADTTIRACRVTLLDCERLRGLEKARADTAEKNEAALKKQLRGCRLFGALPCPVLTVGVGATLAGGTVRAGPAVSIGLPIRLR